jgi:hypothetical protein
MDFVHEFVVNGVEESVLDEGYFDKVIDFGGLLG